MVGEEAVAVAVAETPCVIAGLAVVVGMVWRAQAEVAEGVVRMVWRVRAEGAAVAVTRDGVEEEVAAPGSSRSGQAVACPRQFIVRAATQLEAILMV